MKRILFIFMALMLSISIYAQEPAAPTMEFALQLQVKIAPGFNVGKTQHGNRFVIPITGGTFEGPNIKGEVLPGGADYQLQCQDLNRTELEAIYCIKTDDGVNIHVRNWGIIAENYFTTSPKFEAPADSKYNWLNNGIFICKPDWTKQIPDVIVLNVWRVR